MNFTVNFKMNRTIYIESSNNREDAIERACEHFRQILNQSARLHFEVEAVRTDNDEVQ